MAPVGFPKFGDDITPDELAMLVRLNATRTLLSVDGLIT